MQGNGRLEGFDVLSVSFISNWGPAACPAARLWLATLPITDAANPCLCPPTHPWSRLQVTAAEQALKDKEGAWKAALTSKAVELDTQVGSLGGWLGGLSCFRRFCSATEIGTVQPEDAQFCANSPLKPSPPACLCTRALAQRTTLPFWAPQPSPPTRAPTRQVAVTQQALSKKDEAWEQALAEQQAMTQRALAEKQAELDRQVRAAARGVLGRQRDRYICQS